MGYRQCLLIILGLLLFAPTARAAAWIETTVVSDAVTLELERDGRTTVAHKIALKVRGGPLKAWTLQGIDADAEPLPDASVVNTSANAGPNSRRELVLTRGDDGSLQIDISDDRGLKQGTYLLQFAYKTDFRSTKMVRARGPWLEIGWIGPRFSSGLDGAKVTFRLPAAPTAPRLPELDVDPDLPTLEGAPVDSFVSTLRRNTSTDEIDLVRAHVAQGEPVLWRLWASPGAFDSTLVPSIPTALDAASNAPAPIATRRVGAWSWIIIALSAAILWTSALLAKLRLHAADCRAQGVLPLSVVRLNPVLRVSFSGSLVAAAILVAWVWEAPTLAIVLLSGAMLLALQNAPKQETALRCPGAWLPLTDSEAFLRSQPKLMARYLDASRWQGKIALALWFLVAAAAMLIVSRGSTYDAALLALMSPLPLPLFLTARGTQLPAAERQRAADWLAHLQRRLSRVHKLKVIAWARFPDGGATPDELRLRVIPRVPVSGLLGLEIAYQRATDAREPTACLIVRAQEGTPAQLVWRDRLAWQRGRRAEERVAIYSLLWPACAIAEDVTLQLLAALEHPSESPVLTGVMSAKTKRAQTKATKSPKANLISVPSIVSRHR